MFSGFNYLKLVLGHLCSWDFIKVFTCSLVFAYNHSLKTCSVLVSSSHTETIAEVVRLRKSFYLSIKSVYVGRKCREAEGEDVGGLDYLRIKLAPS